MLCSVCSTCYQIIRSFQLVIKLSVTFLWHMLCSDGSAGQSNATDGSARYGADQGADAAGNATRGGAAATGQVRVPGRLDSI